MIRVRKEFTFEAAHRLPHHAGHCCEIHGHSYRLAIEVTGFPNRVTSEDPASGMVADFGRLKSVVKERIINNLDHSYINELFDPNIDPLRWESATRWMQYPTAEHMVIAFWFRLVNRLSAIGIVLVRIEVWETSTSCASWDVRDSAVPYLKR